MTHTWHEGSSRLDTLVPTIVPLYLFTLKTSANNITYEIMFNKNKILLLCNGTKGVSSGFLHNEGHLITKL